MFDINEKLDNCSLVYRWVVTYFTWGKNNDWSSSDIIFDELSNALFCFWSETFVNIVSRRSVETPPPPGTAKLAQSTVTTRVKSASERGPPQTQENLVAIHLPGAR